MRWFWLDYSFYEPPNTASLPLEALASSNNKLITLHRRSSPNIIIGGDFNLPGIDWETWQTDCTNKSQHEVLLDFLLNNSLSQLISQVTRPTSNCIPDLLITSSPNLIDSMQALPGICPPCNNIWCMTSHDITYQRNLVERCTNFTKQIKYHWRWKPKQF